MLNKEKFEKHVKKMIMTLDGISSELGINYTTLYRKINSQSDFTQAEILNLRKILNLTRKDVEEIFL